MSPTGTSIKAIIFSVLLHIGALALLVVSIGATTRTVMKLNPDVEIVNAVAIDNQEVEKELKKLREIDEQKQKQQQETERKLKEAEKKLADAEKKRQAEEKRLADARRKQEQETKKREEEQRKTAQLKKEQEELERQRKAEEEKTRKAEAEQARLAAAEKQRQEQEAARAAEAERVRKEQEAAQAQQDQQLLRNTYAEIYRRVVSNFNISGLPEGLKCVISVRVIPGGEIINVSINKSSGNEIFDGRALTAVQKASPLPVPEDAATLDRLRLRHFLFEFSP